jgi:hypothetical protein
MIPGSSEDGARLLTPAAEGEPRRVRISRAVCPRDEFNAYRARLPRSVRRDVEAVPLGHVGLIVQAISGSDSPLSAVYGHVRADLDPADALAALERRLRGHLG